MTTEHTSADPHAASDERTTPVDLGMALYERLTGRGAAINDDFRDMIVEVPRDTGANAPRGTWKLNGTLCITTDESARVRPHACSPSRRISGSRSTDAPPRSPGRAPA